MSTPPAATAETHEGTVTKAWPHELADGTGVITAFTLDGAPGAFHGPADWLTLLLEAQTLDTRCRVQASIPAPQPCADPMCGDGCCDDPECTNVPAEERARPFLVRADSIEWL